MARVSPLLVHVVDKRYCWHECHAFLLRALVQSIHKEQMINQDLWLRRPNCNCMHAHLCVATAFRSRSLRLSASFCFDLPILLGYLPMRGSSC